MQSPELSLRQAPRRVQCSLSVIEVIQFFRSFRLIMQTQRAWWPIFFRALQQRLFGTDTKLCTLFPNCQCNWKKNTCSQSFSSTSQLCVVRISWRTVSEPLPKRILDFILSLKHFSAGTVRLQLTHHLKALFYYNNNSHCISVQAIGAEIWSGSDNESKGHYIS